MIYHLFIVVGEIVKRTLHLDMLDVQMRCNFRRIVQLAVSVDVKADCERLDARLQL